MAQAWADWVHQVLNNGSHDVLKGSYSLELVLGWSANRISVVILLPVLLSLAIGIWLNSRDWSDLATIQTAWGTASYIVTAGGSKFFLHWMVIVRRLTRVSNCGIIRYPKQYCRQMIAYKKVPSQNQQLFLGLLVVINIY